MVRHSGKFRNEHVAPLRAGRRRKLLRRLQTCTHHRTAGIAGRTRRRGGRLATRGARAAAAEAADYRCPERVHTRRLEGLDHRLRSAIARGRPVRGSHCRDRVSLGRGTQRACPRAGGRFGPSQGRCHRHDRGCSVDGKTGHFSHPNRLCDGERPRRQRLLVASLARPGGNLTGLPLQATNTAGKRLELLSEIVPSLHQVAILAKIDNPSAALEIAEARAAAQTLGLGVGTIEIRRAEDISSAFEAANGRMNALYICSDPLFAIGAFASGSWRSARERRRHGRSTELPDRPELVQKGSGSR